MAYPGNQPPHRRTALILSLVAVPVVLVIAVVVVLVGLPVLHANGRWTAVNHTCPALDPTAAAALGVAAKPLPDDAARIQLDSSTARHCFYNPGDDTNTSLHVITRLYQGGVWHDAHSEALAAVRDNPPANLHPIGVQTPAGTRFGTRGSTATLTLITVTDNAVITAQFYDRTRLADASDQQAAALRPVMQTIADQAVTNLG